MASSYVREKLAKDLLRQLSKDQNKKVRAQLQSTRPHILNLDNLNFINSTIKAMSEKNKLTNVSEVVGINSNLKKARKIAKRYQKVYIENNQRYPGRVKSVDNTMAGIHLANKYPKTLHKVRSGQAFIFRNFSDLALCKRQIVDLVLKDVVSEAQLKSIKARVDRGHGAGEGFAVSGVTGARALGFADQAMQKDGNEQGMKALVNDMKQFAEDLFDSEDFNLSPEAFEDIKRLTIEYQQIATASGVSATYIPFITFQDKYSNRALDAPREKQVLTFLRKYFTEKAPSFFGNLEGSSSLVEKAGAVMLAPLVNINGAKIKLEARVDPRKVKLKSKGKPSVAGAKKRASPRKTTKARKPTLTRGVVTKAKQSTVSTATLLGILNSRINDVVASNMGAPRLENRTGRFAGSVRVVDIAKTTKGFPSVGYTYLRDPYGVYESTSGSRFSSVERDPRILIDRSIREIAAEIAIGRLYTRRV